MPRVGTNGIKRHGLQRLTQLKYRDIHISTIGISRYRGADGHYLTSSDRIQPLQLHGASQGVAPDVAILRFRSGPVRLEVDAICHVDRDRSAYRRVADDRRTGGSAGY